MSGVTSSLNLENLPPSPFLRASQNIVQPIAQITDLDLPTTSIDEVHVRSTEDLTMSEAEERAPTARDELRRRLTRAGYAKR